MPAAVDSAPLAWVSAPDQLIGKSVRLAGWRVPRHE